VKDSDKMSKLVRELADFKRDEKRGRHNRTLSLDTKNFLLLQEYCKSRDLRCAEVIDKLIGEFLTTLDEHGELDLLDLKKSS
jgi:hypothetical protein